MPSTTLLTLQALASASSVFQCLSPLPSIYHAHKIKTTGELSVLPLVSLLGVCHIWMMYGYLSENIFPLCATYLFGDVAAVFYVAGYYRYCSDRTRTRNVIARTSAGLLFVTTYAALGRLGVTRQSPHGVAQIVGFVGIAMSMILYASPFETIRQVIATKSAASIPIMLCVAGTISNALWTIYGTVIGDLFVIVPNGICLVLAFVQVTLYCVYNPHRQTAVRDAVDAAESGLGAPKVTGLSTTSSESYEELRSPSSQRYI